MKRIVFFVLFGLAAHVNYEFLRLFLYLCLLIPSKLLRLIRFQVSKVFIVDLNNHTGRPIEKSQLSWRGGKLNIM